MSSKRKRPVPKKATGKRGRKREESDSESDLSDGLENEGVTQPDEILIAGHGDVLDEPTRLPQELLDTLVKPAGQLVLFGMVKWDNTGKKEVKGGSRAHVNLHTPHLFTDLRVTCIDRLLRSTCLKKRKKKR